MSVYQINCEIERQRAYHPLRHILGSGMPMFRQTVVAAHRPVSAQISNFRLWVFDLCLWFSFSDSRFREKEKPMPEAVGRILPSQVPLVDLRWACAKTIAVPVEHDTCCLTCSAFVRLNPLAHPERFPHALDKAKCATFRVTAIMLSHYRSDGLSGFVGVVEWYRTDIVM